MARLIVIIPLVLLVGFKVATWLMKRRTAHLEAATAAAKATIARVEDANRPTIVPSEHGLVGKADLVADPGLTGPDVDAALAALETGDWHPAADLLTAAAGDHDRRWGLIGRFAEPAAQDDTWLLAWRAERPDSADAAVLALDALIDVAWEVRTSYSASQVSAERWAAFRKVLAEAEAAAAEAVRLAGPDDPLPYVAQIPLAMGQSWDNARFLALWAELSARDPHHFWAHVNATQYWCAKWRGSHEKMHAFVDAAIAAAPRGSLLTAVKLHAYYEQIQRDKSPRSAYAAPEVRAAADAVIADLAAAAPDDRRRTYAHGWLVWVLARSGREAEALEHLRALGPVIPVPWSYWDKPADKFVDERIDTVLAATAGRSGD
ncbi:hypothetical protein ACIQBJ_21755 [Kitasatospora sp. NPDC088391]|uniref:hypothetical protein n=1 Tax=Kitasatospora sp. NPDC088391 TaxID=3364074 RepID=UPI003806F497